MAVSKRLRFEILTRDNHTCHYCGRSAPEVKLTVDHVIPKALGGTDDPSNLRAACADCNSGKSSVPPDATRVAAVNEDAERWGAAILAAAENMLADQKARTSDRRKFERHWKSFQRRAVLSDGWRISVDRFIAAGLPLSVLLECIDIAMANEQLPDTAVFKYTCKVAWNKVGQLQRDAGRAVGVGADVGPSPETDVESFAQSVLTNLMFEGEAEKYLQRAREYEPEDDEEPIDGPLEAIAVFLALPDLLDERYALRTATRQIFNQLPSEVYLEFRQQTAEEYRGHGWEPSETEMIVGVAQRVAATIAQGYLEDLDPAEAEEWRACVRAKWPHITDPLALDMRASQYARKFTEESQILDGMCGGEGQNGARCPTRATYRIFLEECEAPSCAAEHECQGHSGLCQIHLEKALDGDFPSVAGDRHLVLKDFIEITPETEAPF